MMDLLRIGASKDRKPLDWLLTRRSTERRVEAEVRPVVEAVRPVRWATCAECRIWGLECSGLLVKDVVQVWVRSDVEDLRSDSFIIEIKSLVGGTSLPDQLDAAKFSTVLASEFG